MTDTLVQDPIATYVGRRQFRMLIGDQFVDAADGATADVLDPRPASG